MKRRCYYEKGKDFPGYGARGIRVCDPWLSFSEFAKDMLPGYKAGLQLDRIDNSGNYSFENCRWATPKENARNKRNNVIEAEDVAVIKILRLKGGWSYRNIAAIYGFKSHKSVMNIVNNHQWS